MNLLVIVSLVLVAVGQIFKQHSMSLMVEIENMLSSQKSFQAISERVEDFKQQLRREQDKHDQFNLIQRDDCASELTFRKSQIEQTYQLLNKANSQLASCESEEAKARQNIDTAKRQLTMYQERLQTITLSIQQIQLDATDKEQIFTEALQTLNQALDILKSNSAGSKSQLLSISQRMIHQAVSTECIELYGPALKLLTDMKLSAEPEDPVKLLAAIVDMFEDLKQMVSQKLLSLRRATKESQEMLTQQKRRGQQSVQRMITQRDRIKEQIQTIIMCVGEQAAEVQVMTTQLHMNKDQSKQAESMCQSFFEEYEEITRIRKNEILYADELETLARKRMAEENRLRSDI